MALGDTSPATETTPMGNQNEEIREEDIDAVEAFAEIADENYQAPADNENELADDDVETVSNEDADASIDENAPNEADESETHATPTDDWSSVPETLREQYQQVAAEKAALEHRLRSDEGRVGPLQKQINELNAQLEKAKANPADAATSAALEGLTPEQIKEFEEDYGDIATFIKAQVTDQLTQHVTPVQQQLSELNKYQERNVQQEQDQALQREYSSLAKAHPDFQQIQQDQQFWGWIRSKPAFVQNALNSRSAADNIELLNLYKSEMRPRRPTSQDLSAHAELPAKGAAKAPALDPDDVDPVEYFNKIAN